MHQSWLSNWLKRNRESDNADNDQRNGGENCGNASYWSSVALGLIIVVTICRFIYCRLRLFCHCRRPLFGLESVILMYVGVWVGSRHTSVQQFSISMTEVLSLQGVWNPDGLLITLLECIDVLFCCVTVVVVLL